MAGTGDIPHLRILIVGMAEEVHRLYPALVTARDIERLKNATNLLLVLARVLNNVAIRGGVSQADLKRVIEKAGAAGDAVAKATRLIPAAEVAGAIGYSNHWLAMGVVDEALLDPTVRSKLPEWFVRDMWPGVLRRAACGQEIAERDIEIAMYLVNDAKGTL